MINIYASQLNQRIKFAFELIFKNVLNNEVQFFDLIEEFSKCKGVKINYSSQEIPDALQLVPSHLLLETHLQHQHSECFEWEGTKAFYATPNSFIPFDMFAASFFLVTRYEEYLPGKRDRHNRFAAHKSFAFINGFLEKPLVNSWALKLAAIIEEKYPDFKFERSSFKYIPTIDIDNAWAFKNKGVFRNLFSAIKDLFQGRISNIGKRYAVLCRIKKDPFDTYDFITQTFNEFNLRPIFFFLLNKKGRRDRGLSPKNPYLKSLIKRMAKIGDVGIHPSYSSHRKKNLLKKEIDRMSAILGKPVSKSRQHYLKMSMPDTYRNLIKLGITNDYTMGFPTRPGFKASICTAFPFFDVLYNERTNLTVHPFQVMDVTLRRYRNLRAKDATNKINQLMEETAQVGGTFVSLWHNESLNNQGMWEDWLDVYIKMTQKATELQKRGSITTTS